MLSKIFIVARFTLNDLLRSKILYVTLFIAFLIAFATFVATEFTYGTPLKIAQDFGFGMLSLSSLGIALFMGASLLPSEIDSRTVYMVISRPVPRWCFILGKILGLVSVLSINIGILSLVTIGCVLLLGGEFNALMFYNSLLNLLESILLLHVVVFFSLFLNTVLSSSATFVLLLLGHAVKESQSLSFVQNRPVFAVVLKVYHYILPAFYKLNLKDYLVYDSAVPLDYIMGALAYGISFILGLLLIIIFFFNNKSLD